VSKIYFLDDRDPPWFPDPSLSDREGLVAVSETLGSERLLLAYQNGIFPWLKMGEYPLWHWFSPDPRFLLFPSEFKISRSLKKAIKEKIFEIRINHNFRKTMESCAQAKRPDQESTWIESDMIEDYCKLNEMGIAHSIEAYHQENLVGGLYGLCLGQSFFGESMFYNLPESSKACLAKLVEIALKNDFHFIDCQVPTPHLQKMGACEIPRQNFLAKLKNSLSNKPANLDWNKII
jgi:leucyl/phenylalanyl-tRNA--protein transferase